MKKLFTILVVLFNFQLPVCFSQQINLIPIQKDSLWGFCDTNKKIVIEPKYNRVHFFKNGYATVELNRRSTIIDSSGREVLPFIYSGAEALDNGLIRVHIGCQHGFIDFSGKQIIPVIYDYAVYRSNHLICEKDSSIYFFDTKGKVIKQLNYDAKQYYDGMAFPRLAHMESPIYGGLIPIKKNKKYGFLKYDGTEVVPPIFDLASEPYNTRIIQVTLNNKHGAYDLNGKEILKLEFDDLGNFGSERTEKVIVQKDGKWGIVDSVGKTIVPFIYDYINKQYFDSNKSILIAAIGTNGKLMDAEGNIITAFEYDTSYCKGYMSINVDPERPAKGYSTIGACVKKGIFTSDLKPVVPVIYEEIGELKGDYMKVKRNNKYGYINLEGKEVIPCKYDQLGDIDFSPNGFIPIFKENKLIGYVDMKGKDYLIINK